MAGANQTEGAEMKRTIVRMLLVVGALAVLAAACGDDSDSSSASTDISTIATDFEFDPTEWTVPEGEEFTIDFTNDGNVEHEWAVMNTEIDSEADFEEEKVLFEVEAIPAGESTSQGFTVDEAGTYQVICAIEGHFEAGMEGTLTVE
jgi:plastocyanin